MGKAVKKILFFSVFGVRYVRFWSRLFTYINTTRRKKGGGVGGQGSGARKKGTRTEEHKNIRHKSKDARRRTRDERGKTQDIKTKSEADTRLRGHKFKG